jgi:hypothetical protein
MVKSLVPTTTLRLAAILWLLLLFIAGPVSVHPARAQAGMTLDLTLEELGYHDQVLNGPVSYVYYYFSLPTSWEVQSDNRLELDLTYKVTGQVSQAPALLEVQLNDSILRTEDLATSSAFQLLVDIPPDALRLPEDGLVNTLRLSLAVYTECEQALLTSLTVWDSSLLHFSYTERPLSLDLAQYPGPVYQERAFQPNQARFVLPSASDGADLQAAVMVAARLGRLTREGLALSASFSSDLSEEVGLEEHLFVIGQPESNPLIQRLDLPLPLAERQLALRSEMPATIVPGQVFTVALTAGNTSSASMDLAVEDRWPPGTTLLGCQGQCVKVAPNVLRWEAGRLAPGQEVSTVVQVLLEPALVSPGENVEHTASLLESEGGVINVDTLVAAVDTTDDGQTVASDPEKGRYFFVHDGRGVAEGDGIVQETASPWSARHVAIVVTGLSEEAVLRAGQALASTSDFPGMSGTYAIVQATQPVSKTEERLAEDITFASLGYGDDVLTLASEDSQYAFRVPRAWTLTEGAGLALHFAHGAALDMASATLEIRLNGVPIHSVWLDERNAYDAWRTIPLYGGRLTPGSNWLSFQLSGDFDECMDARLVRGFWLAIYSDTFLHLPHQQTESTFELADFPRPFSSRPGLGNLVFLLPERPIASEVEGLLRVAALLGNAAQGDSFLPQVVLGGEPEKGVWREYQIIALGRPTSNPYIAAINDSLPQPFVPGTDEIWQQVDQVIYRLPPGHSLGHVQLLASPWDENQAMLVVTGSTDEGVSWAIDALTDSALSRKLAGNLVTVVREGEVQAADTRAPKAEKETGMSYSELVAAMTPEAAVTPTPTMTPPPAAPTPTAVMPTIPIDKSVAIANRRPVWFIPVLSISVLTMVAAVGLYVWQNRGPR